MKKKLLSLLLVFCLAFVPASIVPVFAEEKGMSKDNPFTTIAEYNAWLKSIQDGDGTSNVNVYVKITGGDFDSENDTFHIEKNVQNWKYPPKLYLEITGATFTGNTAKDNGNPAFMYLPNCQKLVIDNCTFDTGDDGLKYGINWNLCGIQDSEVTITNCTFKGTYTKNAIKLTQRGGSDDKAEDMKNQTTAASIASATISGCTFEDPSAKIFLGTQAKDFVEDASKDPFYTTGNFPVDITNCKSKVKVEFGYTSTVGDKPSADVSSIELNKNGSLSKESVTLEAGDSTSKVLNSVIKVGKAAPAGESAGNDEYYIKFASGSAGASAELKMYSDADCNENSVITEAPPYTAPTTRPASTTTERSLGYRLPMITKEQKGFDSDTTQNFTVNGKYQFRITSLNGQVPVMTCGNNAFTVELASQEGNDYFFVIRTAVPGSTGTIYVNGYYLLVAAAA